MMTLSVLLIPLILCLGRTSGTDVDPTLPFSEYLDSNRNVLLRWGFDVIKDTITLEVTVNTTGWVGFGFSPNGEMAGSDMVIGGVGPEGRYFTDRHATGTVMPIVDEQQDYKCLSLAEANGQTVMKFQRSIKACNKNDFQISEAAIKLIYAYGITDEISYHQSRRGTKEVNLQNYMPRITVSDSKYFDVTMNNFTIPAQRTHYQCKITTLPVFNKKHHIYRIEPLIQNLDLVHHMLLYRCPSSVNTSSESECYTKPEHSECFQAVTVWGVGGGASELPEVAGLPVGGEENKIFYRLEIHYNNPQNRPGVVDSSGLRFYYTAELRQYDAGLLQTGLHVSYYGIPPKTSAFLTYGMCDTSNLTQVLPEAKDLQVFAVFLHTHLAGRKVRVGHFRNGEQIDYLAINEHYNFELQQMTNLGSTKTVKLGDQLVVECTYNTDNRTDITWGGLGTNNEMCMAFLYYYPALNLSVCSSTPNLGMVQQQMGAANLMDWLKMMTTKVWDNTSVLEYQKMLKNISQDTYVGSLENYKMNSGKIPDLKLSLSTTCMRDGAGLPSAVPGILLLGLTLSRLLI